MGEVTTYIGVGSNEGSPLQQCRKAIDSLGKTAGVRLIEVSSFYRTAPVGLVEQADFINAVCGIRSFIPPGELLQRLKDIERAMGRRETVHWGPRIIDLDILLYGQEMVTEGDLVIPHPELHKRRFVLEPLNEIASYVIHPAFGISVRGLLDRLADPNRVERLSSEPSEIQEP